jgi:hypothetical protein
MHSSETIAAAVAWWANQLRQPPLLDNGTGGEIERALLEFKAAGFGSGLPTNTDISAEQIKNFSQALALQLESDNPPTILDVDYDPCEALESALAIARISSNALPIKSTMWLESGTVRKGYGGQSVSFL